MNYPRATPPSLLFAVDFILLQQVLKRLMGVTRGKTARPIQVSTDHASTIGTCLALEFGVGPERYVIVFLLIDLLYVGWRYR